VGDRETHWIVVGVEDRGADWTGGGAGAVGLIQQVEVWVVEGLIGYSWVWRREGLIGQAGVRGQWD
jgi:hypothetical protein